MRYSRGHSERSCLFVPFSCSWNNFIAMAPLSSSHYETRVTNYQWTLDNFGANRYQLSYPLLSDIVVETDNTVLYLQLEKPTQPTRLVSSEQTCETRLISKSPKPTINAEIIVTKTNWFVDSGSLTMTVGFKNIGTHNGVSACQVFLAAHSVGNGTLKIRAEITWRKLLTSAAQYAAQIQVPNTSFTAGMFESFRFGRLADFTIVSSDRRQFLTQKVLLAIRIPNFFGIFFDSKVGSGQKDRMAVVFDGETLSALLDFVYTDQVVNICTVATHLIQAAHMYGMDRLMALCSVEITRRLNFDNLSETAQIAQLYQIEHLTAACNYLRTQ